MENTEKPKPKFVVIDKIDKSSNSQYIVDVENKELYTDEEINQARIEYFLSKEAQQKQIKEYEAKYSPTALKEKIIALEEYIKELELQVRYAEHKGLFPDNGIIASKQERLDFIKRQMEFDKTQRKSWDNPPLTIYSANEFGRQRKKNNGVNDFSGLH